MVIMHGKALGHAHYSNFNTALDYHLKWAPDSGNAPIYGHYITHPNNHHKWE